MARDMVSVFFYYTVQFSTKLIVINEFLSVSLNLLEYEMLLTRIGFPYHPLTIVSAAYRIMSYHPVTLFLFQLPITL